MAIGTTKRQFTWTRETPNFQVYETQLGDGKTKRGVLYLPSEILVRAIPHTIEVITGSRPVHHCDCEYCTRRCL